MPISIQEVSRKLTETVEKVQPGMPQHLTSAHDVNDGVWQGDLAIVKHDGTIPSHYKLVEHPTDQDRQLVPKGGGPGSHHRLKSLNGVKIYRPEQWGKNPIDTEGPIVIFDRPNAIVHESGTSHPHGTVHIDDPMAISCTYQRNWNAEQREARRAAD